MNTPFLRHSVLISHFLYYFFLIPNDDRTNDRTKDFISFWFENGAFCYFVWYGNQPFVQKLDTTIKKKRRRKIHRHEENHSKFNSLFINDDPISKRLKPYNNLESRIRIIWKTMTPKTTTATNDSKWILKTKQEI